MSIHQGLISPPLSGRTDKADKSRMGDAYTSVSAAHIFGAHPTDMVQQAKPCQFEHRQHNITSPVKKHADHLSDAERAARPLTPPMSKDVRHDDKDDAHHHRASSEGDHFIATSTSSSSSSVVAPTHEIRVTRAPAASSSTADNALWPAAPITTRFGTLTQATGFESDDEHNPFLDRQRPASSSSSEASKLAAPAETHAHHSHPYYDEYDSDQDAPGSVHNEYNEDDGFYSDATPRASSSNATTPPHVARYPVAHRLARPFSAHIQVESEPVTAVAPIRDTPNNPFLAGGPADNGFQGPNAHAAHRRARQMPGKERGKITYVFRGQRVTYADPEYDSDDDDDSDPEYARTNEFNPHYQPNRPPRLQPRLLFPPTRASSSTVQAGAAAAGVSSRKRNGSFLPRAEDDGFGRDGSSSSSNSRRESEEAPHMGGGLFAAQLAAKRKHDAAQAPAESEKVRVVSRVDMNHHDASTASRRPAVAPSSSARLQSVTQAKTDVKQTARDALLARLDQTNWSDDDDEEGSHEDVDHEQRRRRRRRDGSEGTEDEVEVESRLLPRSQSSQHKRLSDELHAGHEDEVDAIGRPLKRWRASYAF